MFSNNKEKEKQRFTEIASQTIGSSKQIVVFADNETGVCYMTSTARESDIIMMRDKFDKPLIAKDLIKD
ncbi:hypothetical protein SAMN02910265_01346 [Ruminococcus flavefaciens]|uniref:DUF6440 domain-containing protein n=1 Tax=Ruminococcus flavefaciens TaxID=1265 RepID=A0A1H6IZ01_RUMFL|nr:DUF6440 family protein [Ruminococcus flavefaciens]SEH54823.1 hypothetical protein SAMN02910265_01346 [Ruminococcus flavefaciens]